MAGTVLISLHSEHSIAACLFQNRSFGRYQHHGGGPYIPLYSSLRRYWNLIMVNMLNSKQLRNVFGSVNSGVMLFLFALHVRLYGIGRRPECLAKTFRNYEDYSLLGYDAIIVR